MNDQTEDLIKSFGPTLRQVISKTQENTMVTLINALIKQRDSLRDDPIPDMSQVNGIQRSIDTILSYLEALRDSK